MGKNYSKQSREMPGIGYGIFCLLLMGFTFFVILDRVM